MDISPVISARMQTALRGESALWIGRPDAALWFGRGDPFIIPFTVLWAGFAVFWNVGVWRSHAPTFLRIFGIPFLLVGAYVLVGRFFVKRRRKQRLEYGLTAGRAIIVDTRGGVRDVPLSQASIEQIPSRDGRHITVTFGSGLSGGGVFGFGNRSMPANSGMDGFGSSSTATAFFDVAGVEAALARVTRR